LVTGTKESRSRKNEKDGEEKRGGERETRGVEARGKGKSGGRKANWGSTFGSKNGGYAASKH